MRILVAIPVFNEEQYVPGILSAVRRFTNDILVIDDGSTDATPKLLAAIPDISIIRHPENKGYGRSLIDAFRYAEAEGYDWIITLDCDDQHEPQRIPAFIDRLEHDDVDVVSGSRYLMEIPGNSEAPPIRRRINQQITRMLNETLGLLLTDAFCGFKAYRVACLARMSLSETGYAFPMQFWAQAKAAGLRIVELPVRLIYNDPNRHFGGHLDNPTSRLQHYLGVFDAEMRSLGLFEESRVLAPRQRSRDV